MAKEFIPRRFAAATGTTSATASTTVTTGSTFIVMGGGASITTTTAATITCTLTTGSATHIWKAVTSTGNPTCVNFVIGGSGGGEQVSSATSGSITIGIGKNFIATTTETLSLAIASSAGSPTAASCYISGVEYVTS